MVSALLQRHHIHSSDMIIQEKHNRPNLNQRAKECKSKNKRNRNNKNRASSHRNQHSKDTMIIIILSSKQKMQTG